MSPSESDNLGAMDSADGDQGRETFTPGEEEKVVKLDPGRVKLRVSFVRDRLKRSGIRRANLLNLTLGR